MCSNCKNYYSTHCGLKRHAYKTYHICPVCERKLLRQDHLEHHIDMHVKGKRYLCRECPVVCRFKSESSLHNHMREQHKLQLRYANKEGLNSEIFELETLEEFEECTKHYKHHGSDTHTENIILNKLNKLHFYAEI